MAPKLRSKRGAKLTRTATRARRRRSVPQSRKPTGARADSNGNIRVRMYRVGFGDCFLVSLPMDGGSAHILVDCGVHSQGDLGMIPEIVDNVASECGNHLALIIASHAHQDHISGFAKCEDKFKKLNVDEVWLPWTEDPKDSLARQLKQKHLQLADSLRMHMQAMQIAVDDTPAGEALAAVMNAAGNPTALALLKSGVNGGTVRYLDAGKTLGDVAGIKGLTAQILGPPRDEKFLARLDPPKGDRFFKLDDSGKPVPADPITPFEKKWIATAKTFPSLPSVSDAEKKTLKDTIDNVAELAFALDQAINNTSVVALLTYRGKNLLFPGDAQYGNWESWMNKPEGESILGHIDFFKVAHHGSHNATPKSALEKMGEGFAAMISTQNRPWPSIPFKKMLVRLEQKASAVVRSDSIKVANAKKAGPKGPDLILKPGSGFSIGPFWCDYTLAL
jgi:beta-lactamase superfamily II metal-dependent hydrolase